ncbi:Uncharacterised protein [Yersinia mollaretii]|nr:Uncharacterised protein [Yersinia mollaretii]
MANTVKSDDTNIPSSNGYAYPRSPSTDEAT